MKTLAGGVLLMLLFCFPTYALSSPRETQSTSITGEKTNSSCPTLVSIILNGFPGVFAATATTSDTTSPTINLIPPLRYSNQAKGTIEFRASEAATYRCSLDKSAFISCTSPFTYDGLANGPHTFVVIATDDAGNTCAPVTYTWTVNSALAASSMILLPRTGQKRCYDSVNAEIACDGSAQDGETQSGGAWPEPRFNDNGNGTVTDNLTGLVWLRNANCFGLQSWTSALTSVKNLSDGTCGLTDGSKAGEWRLPAINELESLVDLQNANPPLPGGHPFTSVQVADYWSSTTCACETAYSWYVYMRDGYVGKHQEKATEQYLWAVRSATAPAAVVQLPWSGQSSCFDTYGAVIHCIATGQDGELRPGINWPSPRFSDNGDGTQTDNLTGLIWSKDSNPAGTFMVWPAALDYIADLNGRKWLGYGDWRLPNRKEMMSLINREQANGALWLASQGFSNVTVDHCCWSSNTLPVSIGYAWYVDLHHGNVSCWDKDAGFYFCAWPVRGGYVPQKLSVTRVGSGSVTLDSGVLTWDGTVGVARIPPGDTVTMTVIPGAGYFFSGWSGDCTGSGDCTVTMNVAKDVTALFSETTSAAPPTSLMVLTKTTTNGSVSLVSGLSATSGAIYNFEFSNDGGETWTTCYSGESRKTTIDLEEPGTYKFRVFVTAIGYAPSALKFGNHECVFKPDKVKPSHTH